MMDWIQKMIQMIMKRHMSNNEQLKHIMLSNDEDFLRYAQYFRMNKINKYDFEMCIHQIERRCQLLGYDFELGCCGKNKLTRINK